MSNIDWNKMQVGILKPYQTLTGAPTGPKLNNKLMSLLTSDLLIGSNSTKAVGSDAGTPWGMIASVAAANLGGLFDSLNPNIHSDDLLQQAGRSNSSVGGIGYEVQNQVNEKRILDDYDKNNTNKLFSVDIGGFIGGLFGRDKVKKRIKEAQRKTSYTNNFNRDYALTDKMQMDFSLLYGNQEDQMLYAKHGKDVGKKMNTGKTVDKVETASGLQPGLQNAWVSKGEGIYNPSTGLANFVTHGNNDTAKASLRDDDVVFGDLKNPKTGNTFKEDAAQYIVAKQNLNKKAPKTNDKTTLRVFNAVSGPIANALDQKLQDLANILLQVRQVTDYTGVKNYKHGKDCVPRYAGGKIDWTTNFIPSVLGVGASIAQYFDAKGLRVYRPNTYVRNPYQTRALAELDALRINPYPIERQMTDAESRMNYQLNNSGGLSGAQKYLGRIANYNNLYSSIANMQSGIQEKNNAYRSAAYQAKLAAGAQDASNRTAALRADDDVYMKSHAARQSGMQTGIFNLLNYVQNYAKSENQRKMYNGMYDLYAQDRVIEREKLKRKR